VGKNRYNKILSHLKSQKIDQKISYLNERMTTTGFYATYGLDSGVPAVPEIPAIPAVPPSYENVTGGISNPDDFVWGDQGDGSDPNAPVNIPANLYTTYNGEQVAAVRQIEGEYPEGVTPLGYIVGFSWLSTSPVGYLTADGPQFIASAGVFGNASTDLGRSYQEAFNNWPFPGKIQKTVYFWGPLDCLFGTCRGAEQYYPAGLTNETTPKADRALYAYTLWIPADANGNVLPNRFMTDPGSPEVPAVPGVPAIPPKQVVLNRYNLGDPNYYPGPAQPQGQIAQMGPNQVYPLLDIIRQSPPGPTRNNAIQQLNQWAKPGSKNRDILIKLGVPLEGASTSSPQGDVAQLRPYGLKPDGTHGYSKPGERVYDPASKKTFELKSGPEGRYQWMKV
jgi:hypothetical protein